ncbi:salicylate hydroxylase [Paraphaeosphaeria sporulosa]
MASHESPLTYPSQSLQFLKSLNARRTNPKVAEPVLQAHLKFDIVVVGAGLGGLAVAIALARRGHSVQVLEQSSVLAEVGAGIQIPPNSGRLLHRWGVLEESDKWAVQPEAIMFRRWKNGEVIGHTALDNVFKDAFEVPYYVAHRAHLHDALHRQALRLGVIVKLGCKVVQYHEQVSVTLCDGSVVKGSLVVAADGIKSVARESLFPDCNHEPMFNGFAAYRATVDVKKMHNDPEIAWILEQTAMNIWIGENKHVMSYTIAGGESFNMVLSHVDRSDPDTWSEKFAKEHVEAEFKGWDIRLTKIISLIDECMKWPLKVGRPLKTWVSPSSKMVILGDAAHAMLPYMSQGAAMAVEDGAALAVALNKLSSLDELPFALRSFERERIKRSSDMQNASTINGRIWHFPDGPEQKARDASMGPEVLGKPFASSANQWSDPVTQWWAYGYDAEEKMDEAWARDVTQLIASSGKRAINL